MERFDPADLAATLDQAAAMAKLLSTTACTDPSQLHQIHNSLTLAHHHLSSFLSLPCSHQNPNFPQPPPLPDMENSDESAINGEPMQVGEELHQTDEDEEVEDAERNWKSQAKMMDEVEEKMRDQLFIRNKRPKRAISPSSAAEAERRRLVYENGVGVERFDPNATRLRNLELIYQFHS